MRRGRRSAAAPVRSTLTGRGLIHDVCSAVHPMAVAARLPSSNWTSKPTVSVVLPGGPTSHPLDGGRAGVMVRDIEKPQPGWGGRQGLARLFGPSARAFPGSAETSTSRSFTSRGIRSASPASAFPRWRRRAPCQGFSTDEGQGALWRVAPISFSPMTRMMSSAVGMALICAGHAWGWPVARAARNRSPTRWPRSSSSGGRIETGRLIRSIDDFAGQGAGRLRHQPAGVVTGRPPHAGRVRKAFQRYEVRAGRLQARPRGRGRIPGESEAARKAGTVHVIGSFEELVISEHETNAGRMPERPFILVGQQYLADPSRSNGNLHPVWAYAHVPNGFTGDATEAMVNQIERFAPVSATGSAGRQPCTPRISPSTTPITWAATSSPGEHAEADGLPAPGHAEPLQGHRGIWICSAATRPAAASTEWAAPTRPARSSARSVAEKHLG